MLALNSPGTTFFGVFLLLLGIFGRAILMSVGGIWCAGVGGWMSNFLLAGGSVGMCNRACLLRFVGGKVGGKTWIWVSLSGCLGRALRLARI